MNDKPISASPLSWPVGWRRTPPAHQVHGRFASTGTTATGYRHAQDITISQAVQRVRQELRRMGVSEDDMVLSTNLRLRLDGLPASGQPQPYDVGAALYWRDGGNRRCMAIDRYTKVEMNIAALAATIEAMRAIERHGGAVVLERAFTGFTALPAPITASMARPWREVLEVGLLDHHTEASVREAYLRLRSKFHPDKPGGEMAKFNEVQRAYEEAMKELRDA